MVVFILADGRMIPNIEKLRKHLLREGAIDKEELNELIQETTKIFSKFDSALADDLCII